MQKKIIALAIASAMTVPALAYAEATVYGQANLSIDRVSNGVAAPGDVTANQLNSNQSRVGVKGSEDLGSGMSVVWQMEGTVAMDSGTSDSAATSTTSLFDRNTYIGLKSNDMGTVILGRHDTPYKISTRKLDVFADTAADNRSGDGSGSSGNGGLMSVHDLRLSNVLAYISPSFGGMSVAAATVFGAETPGPTDKKGSALSLAGMYSMDAIYATLAYQTVTAGTGGSGDLAAPVLGLAVDDKASAFKAGVGYSMDAFTVNAVVERTTYDPIAAGANVTNTNLYLAGKFSLSSSDAVKAAFTKHGASSTPGATDDAKEIAIGYDHDMSKTTSVYALYVKETQNATGAADPSVLSFGMKHSF